MINARFHYKENLPSLAKCKISNRLCSAQTQFDAHQDKLMLRLQQTKPLIPEAQVSISDS